MSVDGIVEEINLTEKWVKIKGIKLILYAANENVQKALDYIKKDQKVVYNRQEAKLTFIKQHDRDKEKVEKKEDPKDSKPMGQMVIPLQGKDYATHQGLLNEAHKKGLQSIITELLTKPDADIIVFKATVTLIRQPGSPALIFTGYGDATDANVNDQIRKHKLRMSETRAVNRALRLATNIGMTSKEELETTAEVPQ